MSSIGKLKFCVDIWKKYTDDPFILQTVSGYCIEFDSKPIQFWTPQQINFSPEQKCIVDNEITELLSKGAIELSRFEKDQFISNIFIVPKPNGKFRPVINLRYLNYFVHYEHFKQETFRIVLNLIQEDDFFTSIDLQEAYFAVPIHQEYKKYLKFFWDGQLFQFNCLPFGIASAPRIFTKLLKPIYAWFRQQCIRCAYYIDDSLNMDKNYEVCLKNSKTIVSVLESLGFTINTKKSVLIPVQRIIFFGFIIDSVQFMVFLTDEKICKIIYMAKILLKENVIVIRQLASFIGMIINAFFAILEAPLHYRCLEREKIAGLGKNRNFDNSWVLSEESKSELSWWINNISAKNGKRIRPRNSDITCRTDASYLGWGGYDINSGQFANGRWSYEELGFSINYLELLAIFHALQSLYMNVYNKHIVFQSDNVSAVSYINEMGGMNSLQMDTLAGDIWQWCLSRNIYISSVFIPGITNIQADFLSRNFSDSTEWKLKTTVFQRICKQCFMPDIDLFASRLNRQLDKFVSWFPEPSAFCYNAFSLSWHEFSPYIFAPFSLIANVINKILADEVEKALLIIPYWKSQTWFPLIVSNLISYPIRLPRHRDLLTLPHDGRVHPLSKSMRMVAVVLSGKSYKVRDFQNQLLTSLSTPGDEEHKNNTVWPGKNGIFGVYKGQSIPFIRLKQL